MSNANFWPVKGRLMVVTPEVWPELTVAVPDEPLRNLDQYLSRLHNQWAMQVAMGKADKEQVFWQVRTAAELLGSPYARLGQGELTNPEVALQWVIEDLVLPRVEDPFLFDNLQPHPPSRKEMQEVRGEGPSLIEVLEVLWPPQEWGL